MTEGSWDNEGMGAPPRSGMPGWAKVLLGCGVAAVLALGACVGGAAWLGHQAKKDPEAFKQKVMGFALNQIRPEWEEFRNLTVQLQSDEGARNLYRAQPKLAEAYGPEAAFLATVQAWRPRLAPLPELDEKVLEGGDVNIVKGITGEVTVSVRMSGGARLRAVWNRPMMGSGGPPRQLRSLRMD